MAGLSPPARSWFRLASIARMEAAEAAATTRGATTPVAPPLPRIPIPRPLRQPPPPPPQQPTLLPPPQPPTTLQPSPSPFFPTRQSEPQSNLLPTPTPPPEIQTQAPISTEPSPPPPPPPRVETPPESPKLIKPSNSSPQPPPSPPSPNGTHLPPTPPESPKIIKHFNSSRPPSPTTKPNPEPEPETMPSPSGSPLPPPPQTQPLPPAPVEKSIINGNGSRASHASRRNLPAGKEEKPLRLITMAGENTGAIMDIGSAAPRRIAHGHDRKAEQENSDGKTAAKTAKTMKHMEAVVNSNVQGINNSIVLNSSTTQHSPGVHITFASNRKPKGSVSSSSSGQKEHHSDHLH